MNVKLVLGEDRQTTARRISVTAIILSFVLFVFMSMVRRGTLLGQLFFRDELDTFMDYFNCIPSVAQGHPYAVNCMYPPLSEAVFYFFSRIIQQEALDNFTPHQLRELQIPLLSFLLFLTLPIIVTVCAVYDYLKNGTAAKRFVILSFLLSSPFLYMVERGNVLIYALAAAVVFVCYYDSDKKWQREIALIALAISAGIKLYPAILGFLLLRDKRWKEAVRCIIYGVVLFFAPFFLFGGLSCLQVMLKSLIDNTGGFGATNFNCKINFAAVFDVIGVMWFGRTESLPWGQTVAYIISALLVVAAFFTKRRWKSLLFLTLVLIGVPAFAFYYNGVFMLLPFLWFIAGSEKEYKWTDVIYLLCFTAFLSPFPLRAREILDTSQINVNLQVCGVALLVMTLWSLIDTVIDIISGIREKHISKPSEAKTQA